MRVRNFAPFFNLQGDFPKCREGVPKRQLKVVTPQRLDGPLSVALPPDSFYHSVEAPSYFRAVARFVLRGLPPIPSATPPCHLNRRENLATTFPPQAQETASSGHR